MSIRKFSNCLLKFKIILSSKWTNFSLLGVTSYKIMISLSHFTDDSSFCPLMHLHSAMLTLRLVVVKSWSGVDAVELQHSEFYALKRWQNQEI